MTKPTRCADETVAARETTTVVAVTEGCMAASMSAQIVRTGLNGKIELRKIGNSC